MTKPAYNNLPESFSLFHLFAKKIAQRGKKIAQRGKKIAQNLKK